MNSKQGNNQAAGGDNGGRERSSVVSIAIKDKQALYMSYMPYVTNGGLFVPTKKDYNLGDEMFLLVKIMDEPDPLQISGKVVWISPPGALGSRPRGVGLQFIGDTAKKAMTLIENKLGASASLTRATHTM
ncbi:MAG: pilus assembly protein PilZ [Gammaproteobacteria bacterium]|nr:pilus assembly protein PilZ [Gammaproteobacteria bacterium]